MKQKVGRPKSDNPKNIRINLRLTKEEHESMLYVAERLGMTLTEAVVTTMEERADEIWKNSEKRSEKSP